jgi:chemotaxis protein MotB
LVGHALPHVEWLLPGTLLPRLSSERCIRNSNVCASPSKGTTGSHPPSVRWREVLLPAAPGGPVAPLGTRPYGAERTRSAGSAQNYDDPTRVAKLRRVPARSSARRWRFASGFLFFGALTVVAGFYVPLRREADKLRAEGASLRRDLEQTRAELSLALARPEPASTAPASVAPSAANAATARDTAASVQPRIERLLARLRERFGELARAQMLSISSAGDRVSVAIANQQLFVGSSLDVAQGGRALLCDLVRTIMAEFNGQLRVTGYYGKPRIADPVLSRRYATPWELSAARAARAVDALVQGCHAPVERFLVVGYGPRAAGPLGENVALELIFTGAD